MKFNRENKKKKIFACNIAFERLHYRHNKRSVNMKKNKLQDTLNGIYDALLDHYGPQKCYLDHRNPYELLVATILSAQCTDKKVNSVTPALFAKYPTVETMAAADRAELEEMIHPCGFYHAKAGNIIDSAKMIVSDFSGIVPDQMDDLVKLPGVGRKTANVLLGDVFGVPGLPVDTHVKRITNLLGVVKSEDPIEIEQILCGALAPERWAQFSHLLIMHGRTQCVARRADCAHCVIAKYCKTGKPEDDKPCLKKKKTKK